MIKSMKYRLIIAAFTFVIIFMVALVTTYAYFQTTEDHGIIISAGEFEVEMFVYFGEDIVTINSPFYDQETGVITVNAFNPYSNNYVEDLQVYLSITPIVAARYRFKIQQEWVLERYYLDQSEGNEIPPLFQTLYFDKTNAPYYPFSPLKFASGFSAIVDDQGFVYGANIVQRSSVPAMYHLIDSGDSYPVRSNDAYVEECYLYLDMYLEIVQANRAVDVWELSEDFFN